MSKIISVKNLCKDFKIKQKNAGFFGSFKNIFKPTYKTIKAVDKISFSVNEGEILAFIGPNGAGKSTTIKMITGILFPTSGEINILGLDPVKQRIKLAYNIGTLFGQKSQLKYDLPAIDSFRLFGKIYELPNDILKKRIDDLVEKFEIKDLIYTPVRKLSLGQRMKCELVGALIHKPKIIFLDEPTIGMDVIAKQQMRDYIFKLNQEERTTIFLTSHDAGDIESLATRTIVINHGKKIFDDTTEKLKKEYIKTKIVEFIFEDNARKFKFENALIVEKNTHNVKVEIDIAKVQIDTLLNYAMDNFKILDINIYEPPMEEIIKAIYRE